MLRERICSLFKCGDFRRIIKFLIVGSVIFVVHSSVLWLFKRIIYWDTFISASAAYIISAACHFLMNNFFTFTDSSAKYKKRITGYIFVLALNYIISTTIVSIVLIIAIDNVLVATIASTAATTLTSFIILNRLVFSCKEQK